MSKIRLIDVLEEEKEEYKKEVIFEEIMARDFPRLMKDFKSTINSRLDRSK